MPQEDKTVSDRRGSGGGTAAIARGSHIRDRARVPFTILFLLPAFIFLAVFVYYPIEETFRISMTKSIGMSEETFVGIGNYANLLQNEEFLAGLWHVFMWAFWSIVIQLPIAFLIAFALTFYVNKFTKPLRAVFYLSNVLPTAIVAMIGRFVFAPKTGIIASVSKVLGIKWLGTIDFMGNPDIAFWTLFGIATWMYTGFPIIYLMARIEQIPKEIQEAAELDGATGWRYAFSIVMPQLSYAFRIIMVLMTTGSLKLFDLPYILLTGGPGNSTVTLGITLYRDGFINWNYGKAAAIGVVIFVLSLGFTIAQFSLGRKKETA
jgi:raffinose/stachyose/melibiose transport system permease protein